MADGSRSGAVKSPPQFSILYLPALMLLAMVVFLSGCGPPGPRALLKGAKSLERGDYPAAVDQFKTATSLMSTNAQAWNYLGVALQHEGRSADAALAYQRALSLDRDLVEAHYNLGCLWLEQNRPDLARTEFTAYVLRRSKASDGWTKLGVAQMRLRDLTAAEKSFNTAISINPQDAEAMNGLGLDQVQRGRPRDAAQYFASAVKTQPDFGPALLNLATVQRQYLRDNTSALQNYQAYLALTPRQPDWDQVNALANDLEQQLGPAANSTLSKRTVVAAAMQPERKTPTVTRTQSAPRAAAKVPEESRPDVAETPAIAKEPPQETNGKTGALQKMNPLNWFRSGQSKSNTTQTPAARTTNAPAKPPSESAASPATSPPPAQPRPSSRRFHLVQPAPPSFPRYLYLSPVKPAPGDRKSAGRAFAQAQQFERGKDYENALASYRMAAQLDPGWFEAQYDYGVLAYNLNHYNQSLHAYELALAIQPDSEGARYNFALALKAAGYVPDSVNELKKILAAQPNDVRAHLALGNLYAQQLNDFPQARAQYLEVLRLDPGNSQAADIQFWLSSNPP